MTRHAPLLVGCAIGAVIAAATAALLFSRQIAAADERAERAEANVHPITDRAAPEELHRIVLTDSRGKVRIEIDAAGEEPEIRLLDRDGKRRAVLGLAALEKKSPPVAAGVLDAEAPFFRLAGRNDSYPQVAQALEIDSGKAISPRIRFLTASKTLPEIGSWEGSTIHVNSGGKIYLWPDAARTPSISDP